jgi:hypothetical protein
MRNSYNLSNQTERPNNTKPYQSKDKSIHNNSSKTKR